MPTATSQFIDVGRGEAGGDAQRRIAALVQAGSSPGVFWLSGFKSDMVSSKATALAAWCGERGLAFTRFDYSGHGVSGGRFEDGTISRWLDETEAAFTQLTCGPQIVVGSSMGGYLALLLLRRLQAAQSPDLARLQALALIAPAWDMTEELMWQQFPPSVKATLTTDGVWLRPSQYGDPYPITRALIEDGRNHLLARKTFDPGRPIHILHGLLDPDVPWEHTLDLESFLAGNWTRVTAIPDGEHRLSRPEDLAELFDILDGFVKL